MVVAMRAKSGEIQYGRVVLEQKIHDGRVVSTTANETSSRRYYNYELKLSDLAKILNDLIEEAKLEQASSLGLVAEIRDGGATITVKTSLERLV